VFNKYFKILLIICFGLISWNLSAQIPSFSSNIMMYHVSLAGAVDNPGVFLVPASTRVSEVLKLSDVEYFEAQLALKRAENLLEMDPDFFKQKYEEYIYDPAKEITSNGSKRNIVLKRKDQEIPVDLQKFFVLGSDECNPYIMDGDVIFVPAKKSEVCIYGAVNKEGTFELVDDDRISEILELALGTKVDAFLQEVEIVRFINKTEKETIKIDLEKVLANPDCEDNILLKSDDRFYVRTIPQFHEKAFVNVAGEVEFSGLYSIDDGTTTLLEVLMQCGEIADEADLSNAFVQRFDPDIEIDLEFERLKLMQPQNMTYLEYAYLKQKSRELKAMFSVDIKLLWSSKDEKYNIVLKNQDFIYIPQKANTVFVSGQVKNPGYVAIESGQTFEYYVEKAGGYSQNARKFKIRVIKSNSGNWVKPNDELVLEDGDVIFVPEKSEHDYLKISKDVLIILSQIATIFIGVQTLTQ
jgi:protein involved in polysaccharide export with SLBB domain